MLAATALGGVIVSRMNKTPLVLAAGAAALALLNRKKASPQPLAPTRAPAPEPVPAPPPVQVQSQVEQWLTQQIHREASAPVVTLPPAVSIEPEDDYIPQSLLADDTAEITATAPPNDAFASLTEPVFRQPPAAPRRFEPEPAFPALQALEATESCPTSDAAWILGVEPLPSLNESAAPLSLASSMFATEPVPMTHLAAPVVFSAPVFEGGALPDEIEVAPQAEPIMHLTPTLPPEPATAPEVELVCETAALAEVQEIPVQIAAPGEASFDPPLATVPDHPWSSRLPHHHHRHRPSAPWSRPKSCCVHAHRRRRPWSPKPDRSRHASPKPQWPPQHRPTVKSQCLGARRSHHRTSHRPAPHGAPGGAVIEIKRRGGAHQRTHAVRRAKAWCKDEPACRCGCSQVTRSAFQG
jgi:hypothetical protein